MKKGATAGSVKTLSGSVAKGTTISLLVTLTMIAILALVIKSGKLSQEAMGYGVLVLLMVSSVVGAISASKSVSYPKMMVCLLTTICYLISLLCITALFFDGMYRGVPATALVVIAGGIIAGCIPAGQGSGTKRQKRKKRYG